MTLEAFILGCGIMTMAQANHVRAHWRKYDNRTVACAIDRWKQEHKPSPLKSLDEVPSNAELVAPK